MKAKANVVKLKVERKSNNESVIMSNFEILFLASFRNREKKMHAQSANRDAFWGPR